MNPFRRSCRHYQHTIAVLLTILVLLPLLSSCDITLFDQASDTTAQSTSPVSSDADETVLPAEEEIGQDMSVFHDRIIVDSLRDYFFTTANKSGKLNYTSETNAEGEVVYSGLIPVSAVPQDKYVRSRKDYAIRLWPDEGEERRDYRKIIFYHEINEGEERLVVYLNSPAIPLALVFRTYFGSTEAFRQAVTEGRYFAADLVSEANVYMNPATGYRVGNAPLITAPLGEPYTSTVVQSTGIIGYREKDSVDFYILDEDNEDLKPFLDRLWPFGIHTEYVRKHSSAQ